MKQDYPCAADTAKSIVLAHPDRLVREGIGRILSESGFQVVEQVGSEESLLQLATRHKPNIILFDWELSQEPNEAIKRLAEDVPEAILVVLSRPEASEDFLRAMALGARGCLSVCLSSQEFVHSLQMLVRGDVVISKEMVNRFKLELSAGKQPRLKDALSEREREVVSLVGKGATNREIAQKLFVSEHTVKVHLRTILNKLNLRNRQQVSAYAVKEGLIKELAIEDSTHIRS